MLKSRWLKILLLLLVVGGGVCLYSYFQQQTIGDKYPDNQVLDTGASRKVISEVERESFPLAQGITLQEFKDIFDHKGIDLEESYINLSAEYLLNEKYPLVFKVEGTENKLLLYEYPSIAERRKVRTNHDLGYEFEAKNLFIIYKEASLPPEGSRREDFEPLKSVKSTIFKDLNQGKERIFRGSSEHWSVEVVAKYYEHYYQEDNLNKWDAWHEDETILKFIGQLSEMPPSVSFIYEDNCGIGSSGRITGEDYKYKLTLKWGGSRQVINKTETSISYLSELPQEEMIILKAVD